MANINASDATADLKSKPPAAAAAVQKKDPNQTAAQLKAVYLAKLAEVQHCLKESKKYEITLEQEKKAKLKEKVGDLQAIMQEKLTAHTEWQAAEKRERDSAERTAAITPKK